VTRVAVPQQIQITGQLTGPVHDPGDLAHHDHGRAAGIESPQQRKRVETSGVVGADRPGLVVRVLVRPPDRRPPAGRGLDERHRGNQPAYREIRHLRNRTPAARITVC
jgi:hypothetical protein